MNCHTVFYFLFVFFFCGCGLMEKQKRIYVFLEKPIAKKSKIIEKQTLEALKQQTQKPFTEKIQAIEQFIQKNKDKEIALNAYLLKAEILLKNGKRKEACLSYHKVVQSPFDYPNRWKAYFASAKCYLKEKNTSKALEVLERLIQNPNEESKHKKSAAKLQWSFLKNKTGFIQWKLIALSNLSILFLLSKEKQVWQNKAVGIIDKLSPEDLMLFADRAESFSPFAAHLLYRAGEYFLKNREFLKSKQYFKKALSVADSFDFKKLLKQKLILIDKISNVNPYLIGVLVPLSGRKKSLGQKILRGLYMGMDIGKDSPWQILVMDSKSHPDVVRTQLDNLFYKHHVIGLIGGLTSETAEVIAEKAEFFATPAILFSQKKDLGKNRDFVFQNAVTARQLLKPLVAQLRGKLKVEQAALLYPDDFYGKEYVEVFSKIFKEKGGEIVGQEMYKTEETDFKKHIKNLLHLNIDEREEEFEKLKEKFLEENPSLSARSPKLIPENLLPAKIDFQAVFIPDRISQLQKIKDYFRYFGVKDIYLLGTDLWRKNQIPQKTKELSLVFINLSEKNNSLVRKSTFYKSFIKFYARPPSFFEERAYNSAVFLKTALRSFPRSRKILQKEMKKIRNFQGAYYQILISEDQVFHYPLSVYKTGVEKIYTLDSKPVK